MNSKSVGGASWRDEGWRSPLDYFFSDKNEHGDRPLWIEKALMPRDTQCDSIAKRNLKPFSPQSACAVSQRHFVWVVGFSLVSR